MFLQYQHRRPKHWASCSLPSQMFSSRWNSGSAKTIETVLLPFLDPRGKGFETPRRELLPRGYWRHIRRLEKAWIRVWTGLKAVVVFAEVEILWWPIVFIVWRSFGSHRVLLKDKQTTAAAERRATSNVPPELSAEGRIQQVSYCMVNDALDLYCTRPRVLRALGTRAINAPMHRWPYINYYLWDFRAVQIPLSNTRCC